MNLQVNEPTRRPGQPLCQDPWCRRGGATHDEGRLEAPPEGRARPT